MTRRFLITLHALSRFIERYEGSGDLPSGQLRPFLRNELKRAVPIGDQAGDGSLYLLPCGCVAVVVWHDANGLVKTILTRAQARHVWTRAA